MIGITKATIPVAFAFLAVSICGHGTPQTLKCTTWNLEWFPNGSAHDVSAEQQDRRIKEAADVLRPINPNFDAVF